MCSRQYDDENDFVSLPLLEDADGSAIIIRYAGTKQIVHIPQKIQEISVTTIGRSAFEDNRLTSVIIPNSVTEIREKAFSNNQLTRVTIPNSVAYIGNSAFANNQITKITIGSNVYLGYSSELDYYGKLLAKYPVLLEYLGLEHPEANYPEELLREPVFENGFDEFYDANEKKAGIYIFANGKWNYLVKK